MIHKHSERQFSRKLNPTQGKISKFISLGCLIQISMNKSREANAVLPPVLLLMSVLVAAAANSSTSPFCSTNCGQLPIPYPFGIEPGCFRQGFAITCDRSNPSSPRALLAAAASGVVQVTDISVEQSQVRVRVPVSWQCYNQSGVAGSYLPTIDFSAGGSFRISNERNKFTTVGCNTGANFQSQPDSDPSVPYSYLYYVGSLSYCKSAASVVDGVCNGIGCFQSSFPANLSDFNFKMSNYDHSWMLEFSPCTYAFIVDQDSFNFSVASLKMDVNTSMPLWLDWALRDAASCEEMNPSGNYGCKNQNSECRNSTNGGGYQCRCTQGYQGNPYVDRGCQDIDECTLPEEYPCHGVCGNLPGSYRCACPHGQRGDPTLGPCIPNIPVWAAAALGTCIAVTAAMSVICVILLACQRRKFIQHLARQRERFDDLCKENLSLMSYQMIWPNKGNTMKVYTVQDLRDATNDFSCKLGEGGNGTVYRGTLDGRLVAVKMITKPIQDYDQVQQQRQDEKAEDLLNEIKVLSQINHKNVVRLLGCCLEDTPMLVYEYIPKGTLSALIHSSQIFPFDVRLRIAVETAAALAYLHTSTSRGVIHGDVKPNNILLDGNLTVKVSDFGTSQLMITIKTRLLGFAFGTPGYMDPMFSTTGALSPKSDVYSFGVVLLELLTRKTLNGNDDTMEWALASASKEEIVYILDPQVVEEGGTDLTEQVVELAIRCRSAEQKERPMMKDVKKELKRIRNQFLKRQGQRSKEDKRLLGKNNSQYQRLRSDTIPVLGTSV